MKRYVDADKMLERTKAMRSVSEAITIDGIVKDIENHIEDDVHRVRHSRWQCSNLRMESRNITCRYCHRTETINNTTEDFEYCPHCGSKMDGKDGE